MFLNLPDVTKIEEHGLGAPQAVLLGDKLYNKNEYSYPWLYGIRENWLDKNHHTHICINSVIPPQVADSKSRKKVWTAYVPAEAIEAYEDDEYWGSCCNIEPITDKLIPLVSEPELEIEPGETHEYLWDVMPLGNAVPKDAGTWSSSDPEVATIDQNGVLTAIATGKVDITFTLETVDGIPYTATSKVEVNYNFSNDSWNIVNNISEINPDNYYIVTDHDIWKVMCTEEVEYYFGNNKCLAGKYAFVNTTEGTCISNNAAILQFSSARDVDTMYADGEYIISVYDTKRQFLGYLCVPEDEKADIGSYDNHLEINPSLFTAVTLDIYDSNVIIKFREGQYLQYSRSSDADYFRIFRNPSSLPAIKLLVNKTMGIEGVSDSPVINKSSAKTSVPDGIYNLHGQRIADTSDNLAPGLYIRVSAGRSEKILK